MWVEFIRDESNVSLYNSVFFFFNFVFLNIHLSNLLAVWITNFFFSLSLSF